jgi:hypothetical protein
MCSLSQEHAEGLRALIARGHANSATSLLRLQYETLTRALWLLYCASDKVIEQLCQPLSAESEHAAKKLPGLNEMLGRLQAIESAHHAYLKLIEFKSVSLNALNSFVHGGIHPLKRHTEGFPVELAIEVVKNSNGLSHMTAVMMAMHTGDITVITPVREIYSQYIDCLPPIVVTAAH